MEYRETDSKLSAISIISCELIAYYKFNNSHFPRSFRTREEIIASVYISFWHSFKQKA